MRLYASFCRDYIRRTSLWHEPLEEENVGDGGLHEVACGAHKHLTRPSQRRLSIARLKENDGELLAPHSRGAIGRVKPDRPSPLIA